MFSCQTAAVAARSVLQVYQCLLRLLKPARVYTDVQMHGNMKLVQYFQLMQYCVLSRAEKLMVSAPPELACCLSCVLCSYHHQLL